MTAVLADAGRVRESRTRLPRALLGALIVLIAGAGAVSAARDLDRDPVGVWELASHLVPIVVAAVVGLMIVFATRLTLFRGYLSVMLGLFVTSAAGSPADLLTDAPAVTGNALLILSIFGFLPVGYFFPNGRAVPRWSRWLPLAWVATGAIALSAPWDAYPASLLIVLSVLAVPLLLSIVLAQILRYRHRSTPEERQQTKWLLVALVLQVALILAVMLLPMRTIGRDPIVTAVFAIASPLALTALPAAIGVAMLRYRLFDVDLLIGRALTLGAVTVFVLGVYASLLGFVGLAWPAGTPVALPIIATAVAALGVAPVHRKARRRVNRWLYGDREDPATVLARLTEQLSQSSRLAPTLQRICGTLHAALRLDTVAASAWEVPGHVLASARTGDGCRDDGLTTIGLQFEGRPLGTLRIRPRPGERLNATDLETVHRVASAAGVAVHAALMTERLQLSRAALVTAREQERARLHRDLHDGIGPTLASVSQRLGGAQAHLSADPERAVRMLLSAQQGVAQAMTELRAVVAGIRPPALVQLGLAGALRAAWPDNVGPRVTIVGEPGRVPSAVETAAYRIAMEAISNAVRHSAATRCGVEIVRIGGDGRDGPAPALQLCIEDDGIGGAAESAQGAGLRTMRERAEELGGAFRLTTRNLTARNLTTRDAFVHDAARSGTRIDVLLPVQEDR